MNFNKKKYLFINPWDKVIGPNIYLLELLKYLPDIAENSIIIFHKENNAPEDYKKLGCQVIISPFCSPLRFNFSFQNLLRIFINHTFGIVGFMRILGSMRPEVVVINTELLWIAGIACKIFKIPCFQIFHALTFSYRLGKKPKLLRLFFKLYDFLNTNIISVSDTVRNDLILQGINKDKTITVYNSFSLKDIELKSKLSLPSRLIKFLNNHSHVIVSAGRISHIKGHDLLIKALPEIFEAFPGAVAVFAGKIGSSGGIEDTDSYFAGLLKFIKSRGIKDKIIFLGEIDFLPELLNTADIYVQPSRTESFGRVAAEALICGTPVVGFDLEAIKETAGPGARLVAQYDTKALAEAVIKILSNPDTGYDMAKKGKEHVIKKYDTKIVAKHFSSILKAAKICAE